MDAGHAFTTMHITKTKNNNALLLAGYQSQLHSLHNYKQQQFYLTTLAIILAACYTNAQRSAIHEQLTIHSHELLLSSNLPAQLLSSASRA